MPKLNCLCGQSINLSPLPNEQGFKVFRETRLELVIEQIVNVYQQSLDIDNFTRMIYLILSTNNSGAFQIYQCQHCKRVAVFDKASDTEPLMWFALIEKTVKP